MPAADSDRDGLLARLLRLRQRCATAVDRRRAVDPEPDDRFRGLYVSDDRAVRLATGDHPPAIAVEPDDTGPVPGSRLDRLGLDALDAEILLVALAPDLDPRFEQLYGYLHDDVTRRRASTGLALELAGIPPTDPDGRARLAEGAPLLARRILSVGDDDRPFLTRALRVPDRVVAHLLGDNRPDPALTPWLHPVMARAAGGAGGALARAAPDGKPLLVHLRDDHSGAGPSYAAALLADAGLCAVVIDVAAVPDDQIADVLAVGLREATLTEAGLVLLGLDAVTERPGGGALVRSFADAPVTVVVVGGSAWDPRWSARIPLLLAAPPVEPASDLVPFRLAPEAAERARAAAALAARSAGEPVNRDYLAAGARAQNGAGLERLARRIPAHAGRGDLVLPPIALAQLDELVARVRQRPTVLDRWRMGGGASRGQGVTALFAGESGTGKTLSAEVVAGELGLDLYVVDLATVVDKYIGETEKNLDRIFAEADRVNGVLLFDEADAIFGKRSEVTDARDRYANVEIAYLLQRMERFDGVAILTTNLRANLDDAFLRRLDVLIDFPNPDADARRRLWEKHLPPALPLDEPLDLEFMARAFELSGGNIRNITLTAAFLAAEVQRPVGMVELTRATEREYRKLGRLCLAAEFGPYHELVTAPL